MSHEIQLALRTAAGHERAALQAEEQGAKTYEMKMKSAGASAYEAFVLAIKEAPDYQGRKIDDKAIQRIYQSTKARPWWDKHLAAVKVNGKPANREWAKRVILWHTDPEAAKARHDRRVSDESSRRKHLKEQRNRSSQGPRGPQASMATHAAKITGAARTSATGGRVLPSLERLELVEVHATREDCAGEINRIKVALGRLKEGPQFDTALELLKAAAREIERL